MSKRSGTYSRIYLHFVWGTKNRLPMIDAEIRQSVIGVFVGKAKELGLELIDANGTEDHMHVLLKSPANLAPSDIAKELKGASSHLVNHTALQGSANRSLYWQDGYGVISVSPSVVNSVRDYIRKQVERHSAKNMLDEFEM